MSKTLHPFSRYLVMNHPPLSPKYIHQKYIAQAAQQQVFALFAAIAYIMMNSFQYAI